MHRNAVALLKIELEKRFEGQNPTRNEITDALIELVTQSRPFGELKVEIDPDQPGALRISGTGSMADWIKLKELCAPVTPQKPTPKDVKC